MTRDSLSILRHSFRLLGPLIGLAFVSAIFAVGSPSFLSAVNISLILKQTVIVALAAVGMTMVIVGGGIDLSVGSIVAVTGVVAAVTIDADWPTSVVIAMALLAGGACGLVNGAVIAGWNMAPFIVTLGMMGIARGLAKWLGKNQAVNYPAEHKINLWMNNPAEMAGREVPLWMPPLGVGVVLLITLLMTVVLARTVFGRRIYALGSSEATARLCGVPTRRMKLWIYSLAGILYGLAGLMQLSRLRQGDPTVAVGLELDVIAAVVIGGASLSGGSGGVGGAIIGALIMAVLRNGSVQMGWENYVQDIMIGTVIILAVALDKVRSQRAES